MQVLANATVIITLQYISISDDTYTLHSHNGICQLCFSKADIYTLHILTKWKKFIKNSQQQQDTSWANVCEDLSMGPVWRKHPRRQCSLLLLSSMLLPLLQNSLAVLV